ncbi:hypothetical protein [Nonomuraea turcica]|nr:hypothetical protein [Nonomuraea sp. G32]MDP4509996.1 hypothetical protein [Nonomuraea sp. G32]
MTEAGAETADLIVQEAYRVRGGVSVAGAEVTAGWIVLNPDTLQRWHRP